MFKADFSRFGFTKHLFIFLIELAINSQLIYGVVNFDIFNIIQGLVFTTWLFLLAEMFRLWAYVKTGTFVDKEPTGINLYSHTTTYIGIQTGLFCYLLDVQMKWPFLIMNLVAYIFTCLILLYLPNGIRMANMRREDSRQADISLNTNTRTDATREDDSVSQVDTTRDEARKELETLRQLISELQAARHELEKSKHSDITLVDAKQEEASH